ncbi:hypothetical protein ABIE41_001477 [Bosea sp. OAE506]|uniref:hypothetical protein n=1 Tax=Bosea sp. OAE506 TaxID=2663870 RepID=UPI00178A26F3
MADISSLPTEEIQRLLAQAEGAGSPVSAAGASPQAAAPALDLRSLSTEEIARMLEQAQPAPAPAAPSRPGMLESFARGGGQGATLGMGDEIYAAGAGALAKARGQDFGPEFERQLAEAQANNRRAKEEHPWTYAAGEVLGVIPGLAVAGTTALGARALGLVGKNLATRSMASAGSGAAIGAIQGGAGTGGTVDERLRGAGNGAVWGGGFGAAGPALGQAVGAGVTTATQALRPGVHGVSRQAATMLADDIANSGGPAAIRQRLNELGPDAMLMDASPSTMGRAQGLAVLPDTRELVTAPLVARNQGTNRRLASELESALGPSPVPTQVEGALAASRRQVSEAYEPAFRDARAVDTSRLANALDTMLVDLRGPAREGVARARGYLNIPGSRDLDPNPRALFETRQAIDGLMQGEANSKVLGQLGFVRQAVDDELRAAVPGIKEVDARFQELARQSEGLQRGSQVLDGGKTALRPVELADEIARGVTPEGELVGPSASAYRMRQGTRAEIDRLVGTRANDLEALRQAVKGEGDWNRAKLSQLFGEAEATRVFNAVDREAAFRDAYRKVVENSQTAQRTAAAGEVAPRGTQGSGPDVGTVVAGAAGGVPGAAMAMGARGLRAANNSVMRAADIDRNKELARLLTSPADPRTTVLIDALAKNARGGERAIKAGERARTLAQILMASEGERASRQAPKSLQFR